MPNNKNNPKVTPHKSTGDWVYTETVKEHFMHPKNILEDEKKFKADGSGYIGNPQCGDMMLVAIKVNKKNQTISECKWKTYGCASAVASTSALSEMVIGMTLEKAYEIKPQDIIKELGGLPTHKIHCSVLGDKALRAAIDDYYQKTGQSSKSKPAEKDTKVICTCLNVTIGDIKQAVKNGAKTFEELQEMTKISTACGGCKNDAIAIFEGLMHE